MFKFLKEKLGLSIAKISKKIEQEMPEEEIEIEKELPPKTAEKPKEEIKTEIKEKAKTEPKQETKTEEKKEEIIPEPEKKGGGGGLFGKFKNLFKKEKPQEIKEETEEKKVEGEKLLQEIKKDFTEKELQKKKEDDEKTKKEEVEKRIQDKVKAGEAPSLQDLLTRREIQKPKKEQEIIKPKQETPTAVKKPEETKIIEKQKEGDLIRALAAGRKLEEIKKEEPKISERPKEEDIIKRLSTGQKIEQIPTEKIEEEPEKKSFFAKLKEKIITKKISEKQFDDLFWELEVALLENNVAVEVIEKIKNDLKNNLLEKPVLRNKVDETVANSLKESIKNLFEVEPIDLFQKMEKKKPLIICFVGINGSGKTTTIAKVAALVQKYKFSVVIAAADTFRAAAINQLEEHANNLGIKLIKHDYGSDPAAVAFDAIKYAESKGIDVVLIDTAGRMHSNTNLMDEMKKIVRVAKPDLKIFVGESITGNDCVEQAKQFNETIGIDGIILSKADVDEKGGAAISVSYVTKKPIMFMGIGQRYEDLEEFDSQKIMESLGL